MLDWFQRRDDAVSDAADDAPAPLTSPPPTGEGADEPPRVAAPLGHVEAPVGPPRDAEAPTSPPRTVARLPSWSASRPPRDDPAGEAQVPEGTEEPAPAAPTTWARTVCVANQKGGVGKTTTAVSLAAALAEAGADVLLVDLDPQCNATTGLGLRAREGGGSTYQVLVEGLSIDDAIEPTSIRRLHCVPSSLDLAGAEIELVPAFSREHRLERALEGVRDLYDLILIDCPPTLGLLTVNALVAADLVLLPIQCEYYALEGVGQLTRSVEMVRVNLNPDLDLAGVVLTMYDARTRLAQQVVDEVRQHFGDKVFRTIIPRTVRLSEAPGFGQPITVFDPDSRGARAYVRLADELATRLGLDVRARSPLDRLLGATGHETEEYAWTQRG